MSSASYQFQAVAIVHSVFKEKFAIPRQSGLAPSASAVVELLPPFNRADYVDGLAGCSHVWLLFVFHQHLDTEARAKVRPPRLGGNQKMGVFATRSPVRPNPIGLSAVKLQSINCENDAVLLHVSGVDLLDNTPILDIKPYVPYSDAIGQAVNPFAATVPAIIPVLFTKIADQKLDAHCTELKSLLLETLQQDPRPQYQKPDPERVYGVNIDRFNVTWRYRQCLGGQSAEWSIEVLDIQPI